VQASFCGFGWLRDYCGLAFFRDRRTATDPELTEFKAPGSWSIGAASVVPMDPAVRLKTDLELVRSRGIRLFN
jgi:hypothetical protein